MLSNIKEKIYVLLIEKNSFVRNEYLEYIQSRKSKNSLRTLKKALKWNVKYIILRGTPQKDISKLNYPETEQKSNWNNKFQSIYKQALKADIIFFDIFDTMILTPFSHPTDIFILLEKKWRIANFRELRIKAEEEVLTTKKESSAGATLQEIYSIIEKWCSIPVEEGVLAEIELKKQLCFVNPEIKKLYNKLIYAGKTIIFIEDTSLPSIVLTEIFHRNGINGFKKIFTSCEYGYFKLNSAVLYFTEKYFGKKRKYYHICSSKENNIIEKAKINSWKVGFYPNPNIQGKKYRPYDMSAEIKSIYDSICNSWLYSNQNIYNIFYEFGFTCGGILVIGICQWLNQLAKQYDIEQILFVARDGDIVSKVYRKYFNQINNNYLLFSRMASEQLVFNDFTEEYINHVILPEMRDAYETTTVCSFFKHIGLGDVKRYWEKEGFSWNAYIQSFDYEQVRIFIYKYKHEINNIFHSANAGAEQYFRNIVGSNKRICVFDIGWRGTSVIYLKHLLETKYQLPVQVFGALVGRGTEKYASSFFLDDSILTYAFSQCNNSKLMEEIFQSQECILGMELLFSSSSPSLLAYGMDSNGKTTYIFQKTNPQADIIKEIHNGILDYVRWYYKILGSYASYIQLHAQDAIAPVMTVLRNKKYLKTLTKNSEKRANARHGFEINKENKNEF